MSHACAVSRRSRARSELEFLPFSVVLRISDNAERGFRSIFNLAQHDNGFQGGAIEAIDLCRRLVRWELGVPT